MLSDGSMPPSQIVSLTAVLTCLFFTSLQRSIVNQPLFSSYVLSSGSVYSPQTRYLWDHPSSIRAWASEHLDFLPHRNFVFSVSVTLHCLYRHLITQKYCRAKALAWLINVSFYSCHKMALRCYAAGLSVWALKPHCLYLLHKQRHPKALFIDRKQLKNTRHI